MHKRVRNIHFVGIAGSGMSGIAEVLANLNYRVSGSDISESSVTQRLRDVGIVVHIGHHPSHIESSDVVVISSAIADDNPEIQAASRAGIPVIPRAEMLGEIMRFRTGIAVAGTHGKTTTTSLIASVLQQAKLDPTFIVGGIISSAGTNACLGKGEFLVAEADESDASFLNLSPEIAVVTNIDNDHIVSSERNFSALKKTFVQFLQNLPFYGLAVMCADDSHVRSIRSQVRKPVVNYGFTDCADYRAVDVQQQGLSMFFTVKRPLGLPDLAVELALPGRHNVQNALAAIAISSYLGIDDKYIVDGLSAFKGINRRFEMHYQVLIGDKRVTVVDDYAHHPVELAATLRAATDAFPDQTRHVVFQPHRYSRTRELFDDFASVLSSYQNLIICDVYAAGESPLIEASGQALSQEIRSRGGCDPVFVPQLQDLPTILQSQVSDGDLVITLGAGDIGGAVQQLVKGGDYATR